jgi:hypothetical protein
MQAKKAYRNLFPNLIESIIHENTYIHGAKLNHTNAVTAVDLIAMQNERESGIVRGKRMLNRTLEIGHAGDGCAQSQGPDVDEDLS